MLQTPAGMEIFPTRPDFNRVTRGNYPTHRRNNGIRVSGFHECLVKFISFVSIPKLRILSAVLSQISIAKRYLPSRFRSSVLHSKIKFLNWLSLFQMKNYRSIIIVSYRARDFNTFIH